MTLPEALNQIASAVNAVFSKEVAIALAAAYIGARATRNATTKAHEYATQKAAEDDARLTKNTLLLLKVEIAAAWEIYKEEYGNSLLKLATSEPYICVFPIGKNTFPIYDSAPACLANINPETSAKLVRLYMRLKGMIRMIEINNRDCDIICKAGRVAVQKLIDKSTDEGIEISDEAAERLDEYYVNYIRLEGKKLDMAGTADAIKKLSIELDGLITSTKSDIDQITKETP
ncbi:hypothetical protein SRABI130_05725 [Pseudomonas sp. Bi130]|uniref:hypothetical protein n=1 Tax=Pseudomonas sp. Bi130 TaxID=2821122 RepID=UPI001E1047B2|nr:hypothetical protein [Pseudomonas sp. Bi130]CAH0322118.1 hypothetical protein SRABI130_05725 [Pseudomonas sp. Bi130]